MGTFFVISFDIIHSFYLTHHKKVCLQFSKDLNRMAVYTQNFIFVAFLLIISISTVRNRLPTSNVTEALRSICTVEAYQNDRCPYFIGYDIVNQLFNEWKGGDGGAGLWSNGSPTLWWPSGVGLWSLSEFLHTIDSRGLCVCAFLIYHIRIHSSLSFYYYFF